MKRIKSVFTSTYIRKTKMFHIEAVDKFGVKFIHNCHSRKERDECKREWHKKLNTKLTVEIKPTQEVHTKRVSIRNIDPIKHYYTEICEDEGMKYVIENFSAKMFDDKGEQFFMMISQNGKIDYVDELPVARFFLMNKWERDHLQVDDRYVEYWRSYRYKKGYYLVVFLPKIKFRDNQIGFFIRVLFGKEISYQEAKRVWAKLDSIGFSKFEIAFDDIPKSKNRKRLCLDERTKRLYDEKVRRINKQFKTVLKMEAVELHNDVQEKANVMKIRVPKHYRIQRKRIKINEEFDRAMNFSKFNKEYINGA